MLSGPTSELSADIFPTQEFPVFLIEDGLWPQSMFDQHPGQAGSSARLTNEAWGLVDT